MKYLLLTFLLSGCALLPDYREPVKKKETVSYAARIEACVTKFVGQYGVHAKDAIDTCERIYRRK